MKCVLLMLFYTCCYSAYAQQSVVFTVSSSSSSSGTVTGSGAGLILGSFNSDVDYAGTLTANVVVDSTLGRVSSLELTDGVVSSSDFLQVFPFIGVGNIAFQKTNAVRRFRNGALDTTVVYDSPTDPSGLLAMTGATMEFYSGTLFHPISLFRDYSVSSDAQVLDSGQIALRFRRNALSTAERFVLDLTIILSFTENTLVAGPNSAFSFGTAESGTVVANAQVAVESSYGAWARENGVAAGLETAQNAAGIEHRLLHALDLPVETADLDVVEFSQQVDGSPTATVVAPAVGFQRDLAVEYSPDLATPFRPLSEIMADVGVIEVGQSGDEVLSLPDSPEGVGFIRLRLE